MGRAKFPMTFPVAPLVLLGAVEHGLATRAPQQFVTLVANHANHLCTCCSANTVSIGCLGATHYRPGHVWPFLLCRPGGCRRHLRNEESHTHARAVRPSATPSPPPRVSLSCSLLVSRARAPRRCSAIPFYVAARCIYDNSRVDPSFSPSRAPRPSTNTARFALQTEGAASDGSDRRRSRCVRAIRRLRA